jgi:hypothetical protein
MDALSFLCFAVSFSMGATAFEITEPKSMCIFKPKHDAGGSISIIAYSPVDIINRSSADDAFELLVPR